MTGLIINPGSGAVPESGEGWTNTYEGAASEAQRWLREMRDDGIVDVRLELPGRDLGNGRWEFKFHHDITKKVVTLETHGIDNAEAYEKQRIFFPRVYWNGSSCSNPRVEDWAAAEFEVVKTFRRKTGRATVTVEFPSDGA